MFSYGICHRSRIKRLLYILVGLCHMLRVNFKEYFKLDDPHSIVKVILDDHYLSKYNPVMKNSENPG